MLEKTTILPPTLWHTSPFLSLHRSWAEVLRSSARAFSFVLLGVVVFAAFAAGAQIVATDEPSSRVIVAIPVATEDERLLLQVFEQFARAASAGQFTEAYRLLDAETVNRRHATPEGLANQYRSFEKKYGHLRSITADGISLPKPDPNRLAVVGAVHEYESSRAEFIYLLCQRKSGWTVVGFKEGKFVPGAAYAYTQGKQRPLSASAFAKFFLAFFLVIVPVAVLVGAGVHLYRRHMRADELQPEGRSANTISPDSQNESMQTQAASGGRGLVRLFRFGGITVFLHWSWFAVAAFEVTTRKNTYTSFLWNVLEYLALFFIVLLHEFGHALACRQVGGTANKIVLWPLGGVAYVSPPPRPGATLWSIAAGPLVNVILVSVFLFSYILGGASGWALATPNAYALLRAAMYINFGLLVFNLLPIYPLDGGQIVRSLLWFVLGRARSLMTATVIGIMGALGFIVMALLKQSPWFGVLAVFMLMNCWNGLRQAQLLSHLPKLPRRLAFACPSCKTAPPVGTFWPCARCGRPFDAFETQAACPNCGAECGLTTCVDCGHQHPMDQWSAQALETTKA